MYSHSQRRLHQDLLNNVNKVKSVGGTSYIHVFAPRQKGWGTPSDSAIDIGKGGGLWLVAPGGVGRWRVRLKQRSQGVRISTGLSLQAGTFRHLKDEDVEQIPGKGQEVDNDQKEPEN